MSTPEERDAAWERLRDERTNSCGHRWTPQEIRACERCAAWATGRPDGDQAGPPWVSTELLPPRPRPVPEWGWCARCKRMNPLPGDPDDHDGHDWVLGLDQYAYIAGVICPDCLSPEEVTVVLDCR